MLPRFCSAFILISHPKRVFLDVNGTRLKRLHGVDFIYKENDRC